MNVLVLQDIYWQGGRSFWIHNTGPIGCLPYLLERYPVGTIELDRYGCGRTFNLGAQYFNEKLKEVVVQLRKDLPLAALTYVDIYSVKYNLITHAKKYGKSSLSHSGCVQRSKMLNQHTYSNHIKNK